MARSSSPPTAAPALDALGPAAVDTGTLTTLVADLLVVHPDRVRLRDVRVEGEKVVATITPTYTGCPAMAQMRSDLARALVRAGFDDVEVV